MKTFFFRRLKHNFVSVGLSNFRIPILCIKFSITFTGKSTVAALLERFYEVNSGSISIDGHDIGTLDPSWLRGKAIGFINQEPVLFATTVMENIRYGRPGATDQEVGFNQRGEV